jgi:hypothetical protein
MAVVTLTPDQRNAIENSARFQSLVRLSIYNQASYWKGVDGAGLSSVDALRWAKSRYLSVGIINNPNGIDFTTWLKQFIITLKDVAVYNDSVAYDENTVLDYMLSNSKFDELADLVFNLKITTITF